MKIASITSLRQPIKRYDIDVGGLHNFIAEGIVVHNSAAAGLSTNVIRATALNVLETDDKITVKAVNELLEEEFDTYDILQAQTRVKRVIETIRMETVFRDQVLEKFDSIGIPSITDVTKGAVMRYMGKTFEKKYMRHVYHILRMYRLPERSDYQNERETDLRDQEG